MQHILEYRRQSGNRCDSGNGCCSGADGGSNCGRASGDGSGGGGLPKTNKGKPKARKKIAKPV